MPEGPGPWGAPRVSPLSLWRELCDYGLSWKQFSHPFTEPCKRTLRFSKMLVVLHLEMAKQQLKGRLAEDDVT